MSLPPTGEPEIAQPQRRQAVVRTNMPKPLLAYIILGVTVAGYLLQMLSAQETFISALSPLFDQVFSPAVEAALRERGLYEQFLLEAGGSVSSPLVLLGGKINTLIAIGQVWRLFTPALLHASITHILFNMYALYSFGSFLEPAYGRARFLLVYILAAFGGNVLSFLFTDGISVGASTAIFGLLAAQGVFIYQNREVFGAQARSILTNLAVIGVINLLLGLSPGIDNWGHLGGLLAGLAFGWFAGPRLVVAGAWPEFHLEDRRPAASVWTAAVLVAVVFAGLAVLGMSAQ